MSNKIYSLAKIRNTIDMKCALAIYKQTILPLLDYSGFMLISVNKSDKYDLQVLQNNALCICYNVRLRDKVSVEQVLFLLFIYKDRHENVRRIYARNTRLQMYIVLFVKDTI